MNKQQRWIEAIKKLPAWISGAISLVTALIGFSLLLQGERQLGIAILAIVGAAALLVLCAYLAFAKTPPLVAGGKGVYRFARYRPWGLIGMGFVLGFVVALLLSKQNRTFVAGAFLGAETSAAIPVQTPAGARSSAPADAPARAGTATLDSPSGAAVTTRPGEGDCFDQFFSDVPADRIKSAEVGTNEPQLLIRAAQPKDVIVALKFTEFNQPLGAMKFILFPENEFFKVISVVDTNCKEIEAFSNTSGGDKRALSSGDGLQVRFGDREYVLQLIYDPGGAGEIWLGYFQPSNAS